MSDTDPTQGQDGPSGQQPGPPQWDRPQWGQPQYGQPQYGQPWQQPYGHRQYAEPYPTFPPIPTGPDGKPPLWAPHYGIGFLGAVKRFFTKYARFDGRASRSEFWWWFLVNVIVTIVLYGGFFAALFSWAVANSTTDQYGYSHTTGAPPFWAFGLLFLWGIWGLGTIVPSLALGWRRVHDANLAGPFWLITFAAGFAGIVFGCLPPNPSGAQYDRPDQR
ncbi:DUF805 domain-containing protein [Curtobacterium sp. RRHDQ66]|uniref:DUF805 domain-containing protein n=1 Tax=Curtobacterium guangdongense TaxID=3413380 RepID=UPI003BF2202B